ncbi:MAG: tol-pal system protein YbgF [Alphaproteobacteria bacterium]|nr:tol-pal system protein YbgF [Alphaproteobacteria bacterium]
MTLPIPLKSRLSLYSLLATCALISGFSLPIKAEDSTAAIGALSARIEDLENQLSGGAKTDDANPGSQVTGEDLRIMKEEMRTLHDDIKRLQMENADLRSDLASQKSAPAVEPHGEHRDVHRDDPHEEHRDAKPIKSRIEKDADQPFAAPSAVPLTDKDDETESVLKLLEQSAPSDDEHDGPLKKKQKKDIEEIRETATKHAEETAPTLSAGNAEAQYNEAFALYNSGAYKEAERAFSYFIKTYPKDPLVSKAMYWKAESCLKQSKHKEAKILFVNAYKKNPKGPKAPDCLLRLGEALALQGKKDDACTAWRKLQTDFPHITSEMKTELGALKKKYECQVKSEKAPAAASNS